MAIPKVHTIAVTGITKISAKVWGDIMGGIYPTERGFVFGTSSPPDIINDTVIYVSLDEIEFAASFINLYPDTLYYVRAFATNVDGTGYGEVISFKTLADDDPDPEPPEPEPGGDYGVKFRLDTVSREGRSGRLDIEVDGYAGTTFAVQGTGDFFRLRYLNEKPDKRGYIRPSEAKIEIYEDDNFNIDTLKISTEVEYRVSFYENGNIKWRGFIVPDFYSTEVGENLTVVSMVATDRLATLHDITLDVGGTPSLLTILTESLKKTGMSLNTVLLCDFQTVDDTYVFFTTFESQRLKDDKGRDVSCYDLIRSILVLTNSYITQRHGAWFVVNKRQQELGDANAFYFNPTSGGFPGGAYDFPGITIDQIDRGARRNVIPVAASVGVFHEIGGGKLYPGNYNFPDLSGWTAHGGFVGYINNKILTGFSGGVGARSPIFGDTGDQSYLVAAKGGSTIYLESDAIPIISYSDELAEIRATINVTGANNTRTYFMVLVEKGSELFTMTKEGEFVKYNPNFLAWGHYTPYIRLFDEGLPENAIISNTQSFKGIFEADNVQQYSVRLRIYGGTDVLLINSFSVEFVNKNAQKGNLYKIQQGEGFTLKHDIETTIFGDYITSGINGYFYNYQPDDTSSLLEGGERTGKWTAPEDPAELPLLLHVVRQMARMFSVAHDQIRGVLETVFVDPITIYSCGARTYIMTEGEYSFMRGELDVVLEQVATANIEKRDFIYSHFDKDEKGIRGIAGISEGVTEVGGGTYFWNVKDEEELYRVSKGETIELVGEGILITTEKDEELLTVTWKNPASGIPIYMFWENSDIAPGGLVEADPPGDGTAPAHSTANYDKALLEPPGELQCIYSTLANKGLGWQRIKCFITDPDFPNTTVIPPGAWFFETWVSADVQNWMEFGVKVLKRAEDGTETELLIDVQQKIGDPNAIQCYKNTVIQQDEILLDKGDRLVFEYLMRNTESAGMQEVRLYVEGDTRTNVRMPQFAQLPTDPEEEEKPKFDISDGEETVTINPDDLITLVGDGVEIEVSEDEEDEAKKQIKLTAAGGGTEEDKIEDITFDYWDVDYPDKLFWKLDPNASFKYKIISVVLECDSVIEGVSVQINGNPITWDNDDVAVDVGTSSVATLAKEDYDNIVDLEDVVTLNIDGDDLGAESITGKLRIIRIKD